MKRAILIIGLTAALISGCGPAETDGAATTTGTPGYSNSAPARVLDTPNRARDAAQQANERAKAAQEAFPR